MARIAHISDIHFGGSFNFDVWNEARQKIVGLHPSIIIASGDFVDHPDPLLLLAAKCELEDLAVGCGADTQFFVVAGNHDLLDYGNIWHPGSAWWFERVMFNDTTNIRAKLESGLSFKLGLNKQTLNWARFPRFKRMDPRNWVWGKKCDGRLQSCDYWRGGRKWPIKSIHDQTLITCFDSNSSALREFVFATGKVGTGQVDRIGFNPAKEPCRFCAPRGSADPAATSDTGTADNGTSDDGTPDDGILLRVAVLHHHPLPISVRSKSLAGQTTESKLEPFLILKNGGDLIHELQRHQFDIVLHGHKHRPQFARVELRADNPEGYPLLVLAGGSTAKRDEDRSDNTLRDILTEPNGRLTVRTFEQGELQSKRHYREPLPILKHRAFARAAERTKISAGEWRSEVAIDGIGHSQSFDQISDVKVRDGKLPGLVSNVLLPPYDTRLNVKLGKTSEPATLCWRDYDGNDHNLGDPSLPKDGFYWLKFEDPLESASQPYTFAIREAAANSIAMSQWEIGERSRGKPNAYTDEGYEATGCFISYPVERLILSVKFPTELDGITPQVRCRRHPDTPDFPLTYRPKKKPSEPAPTFIPDDELAKEEAKRLTYTAEDRAWILDIDRPIPGYTYSLQWRVPNPRASDRVTDITIAHRKLLAGLLDNSRSPATVKKCHDRFDLLARKLMTRFRWGKDRNEKQTAFLMLYDSDELCLQPALTHTWAGVLPAGSYEVPLGGGVAGAAFLQRKIIVWRSDANSDSLIKPVSSGALDSRWVLALPIFHQEADASGEIKLDTLPGAVIGVITVGSNNPASKIGDCGPNEKDPDGKIGKEIAQEAQTFAQECVFEIIDLLS